jgi:hypothetical protein
MALVQFILSNGVDPFRVVSQHPLPLAFECDFDPESPPQNISITYTIIGQNVQFDNGKNTLTNPVKVPGQYALDKIVLVNKSDMDQMVSIKCVANNGPSYNINVKVLTP